MSASEFSIDVGRRIQRELDARGWSHRELSRRSEVNQPVISNIVSGKREARIGDIAALAAALGVPVSAILPPPAAADRAAELSRLAFDGSIDAARRILQIGVDMIAELRDHDSA